jgi:hypothetical protein
MMTETQVRQLIEKAKKDFAGEQNIEVICSLCAALLVEVRSARAIIESDSPHKGRPDSYAPIDFD